MTIRNPNARSTMGTFPEPNLRGRGFLPRLARHRTLHVVSALLLLAAVPDVAAQEVPQGVAVYRWAEPGQSVITVDLMGTVRQSGRYFVPMETRLLDLLALSGGPVAAPESDQTVRSITVEVSRAGADGRTLVFDAPFEALMAGEVEAPPLLDGDVVNVVTVLSTRFDWLDGLTVATAVASITYLILRIAETL
jgi:hypothetical protein